MATRITAVEYGPPTSSLDHLAHRLGLGRGDVTLLLSKCSNRLQEQLDLADAPIDLSNDAITVSGIAGLIEVAPGLELEVSPKFLGADDAGWREDFFVFASLSRFGAMLDRDVVAASFGESRDLATLIARTAVRMYDRVRRHPIRLYRSVTWREFEAEGDLEAEDLLVPESDGFEQGGLRLDRRNPYSHTVGRAFAALATEVREPGTRERVRRAGQLLIGSETQTKTPSRVPPRHAKWQPLYDLSRAVLRGTQIEYSSGSVSALGYAVKTADGWQDFISLAFESTLGAKSVRRSKSYVLGMRGADEVRSTPDLSLTFPAGDLLVDAKYKGRAWRPVNRINAADLYEALAFARAADHDRVLLIYPRPASLARLPIGSTTLFDEVVSDGRRVTAADVECRGLAESGGFGRFARGLVDAVAQITANSSTTPAP